MKPAPGIQGTGRQKTFAVFCIIVEYACAVFYVSKAFAVSMYPFQRSRLRPFFPPVFPEYPDKLVQQLGPLPQWGFSSSFYRLWHRPLLRQYRQSVRSHCKILQGFPRSRVYASYLVHILTASVGFVLEIHFPACKCVSEKLFHFGFVLQRLQVVSVHGSRNRFLRDGIKLLLEVLFRQRRILQTGGNAERSLNAATSRLHGCEKFGGVFSPFKPISLASTAYLADAAFWLNCAAHMAGR